MNAKHTPCLLVLPLTMILGGCASFSPIRSAEVNQGLALHVKGGVTSPPSEETYWFYDLGDCPLCGSSPMPATDVGVTYGSKRTSVGLFLSGLEPQLEVYQQLHDGQKTDYGVGGRVGLWPGEWRSGQLFLLFDRRLSDTTRLLVSPGLYAQHTRSPNGWNEGWFLFVNPSVGLAIEKGPVTLTPSITGVAGIGNLSRPSDSRDFRDAFVTASVGISFHRPKRK